MSLKEVNNYDVFKLQIELTSLKRDIESYLKSSILDGYNRVEDMKNSDFECFILNDFIELNNAHEKEICLTMEIAFLSHKQKSVQLFTGCAADYIPEVEKEDMEYYVAMAISDSCDLGICDEELNPLVHAKQLELTPGVEPFDGSIVGRYLIWFTWPKR